MNDHETFEIKWTYHQPDVTGQHTPQMLDNGNILMFVNSRPIGPFASLCELNPITKEIVWEYKGEPPSTFNSHIYGSTQRLKNGNTLVSDMGNGGHVFELTKDRELVWEWYPKTVNPETNLPLYVYRASCYPLSKLQHFIDNENSF